MKLKYTTKVFIVVNLIVVVFRTLQIMFLTESDTAFLKPKLLWLSIAGTVFCALSVAALFSNAIRAVRQPERINCKGTASAVASGITGVLYLISGISAAVSSAFGYLPLLVAAVLSAAGCAVYSVAAVNRCGLSKLATVFPIAYWLLTLVLSYVYYTEKPLRVRTVYEVLAMCFMLLFSVVFGKAVCSVNPTKNFRLIYPLGLCASTLCIASVLPELLCILFGFKDNVSASPVMSLTLVAGAVFSGFFTINTFKKSNTIHPKRKRRIEAELQNQATENADM